MIKLLEIENKELELIIKNASDKLKISKAIIEKDLWVCMILKYLFKKFEYKKYISFKGGTSLSKVYMLIERFSEDIDIALDWTILGYSFEEFHMKRSNSKQLKFNEKINNETREFIKDKIFPILKNDFKKMIKNKKYDLYIDEFDGNTICFDYPKNHKEKSILQVIRIEIGCLADTFPKSNQKIQTYIENAYPDIFDENIEVISVDSLRTFYEKITILHREANRINGNYPLRYSRHFYDVYKMLLTNIKLKSLENIELLKSVIDFKKKFYSCNWAKYDLITEGQLKLIPPKEGLTKFMEDYDNMKNMLFGEKVSFSTIVEILKEYEEEFNEFVKSKHIKI